MPQAGLDNYSHSIQHHFSLRKLLACHVAERANLTMHRRCATERDIQHSRNLESRNWFRRLSRQERPLHRSSVDCECQAGHHRCGFGTRFD